MCVHVCWCVLCVGVLMRVDVLGVLVRWCLGMCLCVLVCVGVCWCVDEWVGLCGVLVCCVLIG